MSAGNFGHEYYHRMSCLFIELGRLGCIGRMCQWIYASRHDDIYLELAGHRVPIQWRRVGIQDRYPRRVSSVLVPILWPKSYPQYLSDRNRLVQGYRYKNTLAKKLTREQSNGPCAYYSTPSIMIFSRICILCFELQIRRFNPLT